MFQLFYCFVNSKLIDINYQNCLKDSLEMIDRHIKTHYDETTDPLLHKYEIFDSDKSLIGKGSSLIIEEMLKKHNITIEKLKGASAKIKEKLVEVHVEQHATVATQTTPMQNKITGINLVIANDENPLTYYSHKYQNEGVGSYWNEPLLLSTEGYITKWLIKNQSVPLYSYIFETIKKSHNSPDLLIKEVVQYASVYRLLGY